MKMILFEVVSRWFLTSLYYCPYLKLRWVHDGFFHGALIDDFYQCLMIFLRELRRHDDLKDDFCENQSVSSLLMFKTFYERDMFSRNFSLLAKAEDIDAGTGTD